MNVATKKVPTSNPYIYTKNVSVQNVYKVQTKNDLKLELYVFCTLKKCINYTKPMELANLNGLCTLCFCTYK